MEFVAASAGIVEQVAELGGVRLDILYGFLEFGITFQDEDLVLGPTLLLRTVDGIKKGAHGDGCSGSRCSTEPSSARRNCHENGGNMVAEGGVGRVPERKSEAAGCRDV